MKVARAADGRSRRKWLLWSVGIILVVLLLRQVDLAEVAVHLANASPAHLLSALILLFPLIGIKALRWLVVTKRTADRSLYAGALAAYFAGLLLGFVTPGRLGEFWRAHFARKRFGVSWPNALQGVFVDRLLDLALLLGIGGAAVLALLPQRVWSGGAGWAAITVSIIVVLGLLLAPRSLVRGLRSVLNRFGRGGQLLDWLEQLETVPASRTLMALGLTILAYGIFFAQGILLARSLGIQIDASTVIFSVAIASLAALLPVSVSGLGTREWALTYSLGTVGVPLDQSLAFSALIFLAFNVFGGLVGGLVWLLIIPRELRHRPPVGSQVTEVKGQVRNRA